MAGTINAIIKNWTKNIIIRGHIYLCLIPYKGGWGVKNICLYFWSPRHFFSGAFFGRQKNPNLFSHFFCRIFPPMLACAVLHWYSTNGITFLILNKHEKRDTRCTEQKTQHKMHRTENTTQEQGPRNQSQDEQDRRNKSCFLNKTRKYRTVQRSCPNTPPKRRHRCHGQTSIIIIL